MVLYILITKVVIIFRFKIFQKLILHEVIYIKFKIRKLIDSQHKGDA